MVQRGRWAWYRHAGGVALGSSKSVASHIGSLGRRQDDRSSGVVSVRQWQVAWHRGGS
jgi:hypothetical protein